MHLFEFGTYQELPFSEEKLQRLKSYLNTVWQNRSVFYQDTSTPLSTRQRLFDFDGNCLRARNYVGFFRFEGVELHVLPKIFNTQPSPPIELCFRHVLYYLSYSQRIRFPFSLTRVDTNSSLFLPEICIFLFASYVENLLTEHPTQMYQERTEELNFLKGQLAVNQYLQENIATGNWQKLHSRHTPLLYDNHFNQIIKYTSRWLLSVSHYQPTQERLQNILNLLQHVSNTTPTYEDCLKIRFSDQQLPQQAILDMCTMFLGNEMINYQVGQKYNFAFLLPMEVVYEDFISGFIQQHFPEWQPQIQQKSHLAKNQSGRSIFTIQPDISLKTPALTLDAKYKVRQNSNTRSNAGIDENDVYQMTAYALGNGCEHLALLYPQKFGQTNLPTPESFQIDSSLLKKPLHISTENLNITSSETDSFPGKLEQNLKDQLQSLISSRE